LPAQERDQLVERAGPRPAVRGRLAVELAHRIGGFGFGFGHRPDRGSIKGKTRYDVRDADVLLEKHVNGLS
jgi:hypothetical protein